MAAALVLTGLSAPQPGLASGADGDPEAELASALTGYLATRSGRYSITVRELDGEQRSLSLSGARTSDPASTIKLFYAWAALRAADEGTLALTTRLKSGVTVGSCLTVMIQISDNPCAVDLRTRLGMSNLNRLFADEGFTGTYLVLDSKGRYVTKRTSSDDLALLLSRLEQGTLLSEAGTTQLTRRLLAQIWRQRISSGVAEGTVVASKSGQLWLSSGMVEADAAIIHGEHSTYVLTVIGTHGATGTTVRGISTIVYRYLQGDFAVRASFPARQYVTTAKVKLQKSPGGKLVRYLPKGAAVQVLSSNRLWMRVTWGNRTGWVPIQKLALRDAYRWPSPD